MSFFSGVNQENAGNFEMSTEIEPIPEGTQVLAAVEEAKNAEYQGVAHINIKWRVAQPAEYANRVLYQKVRCYESDEAKANKGKQMLFAIATNAGGKLFQAMESAGESEPSNMSLTRLCGAPMVLKLGVWELDDKSKSGNWIMAVSARKGQAAQAAKPAQAAPKPQPAPVADTFSDDVPF